MTAITVLLCLLWQVNAIGLIKPGESFSYVEEVSIVLT